MRRRLGSGLLVALLLLGPLAATRLAQPMVAIAASSPEPPGWTLAWSDEFDGPAGAPPDSSKWNYETGGSGWGNGQLEYDTSSTSNAALDGQGHLIITSRYENPGGYQCWYGKCVITSARLDTSTHFSQAYGRFEIRAKIPRGLGMWPSFWLVGNDILQVGWPQSGELDVMENDGWQPELNYGSLHGPVMPSGGHLYMSATYGLPPGQALADAYHTYTLDWSPTALTWYVDGNPYETRTIADVPNGYWVFNHPFVIVLETAVGGKWPGNPDPTTVFPQQMLVDYVRAYQANRVALLRINAASADSRGGTAVEPCTDIGVGQDVGFINAGAWLKYTGVNFGSGATSVHARVASGAPTGPAGTVQLRVDSQTGPLIGSLQVSSTGGWQSWQTIGGTVNAPSGVRDLYLTFTSGQSGYFTNLAWLTFGPLPPSAVTGVTAAASGPGQATLTWTAPTDDGGSPIMGYIIYAWPEVPSGLMFTSNPSSMVIGGLTSGTYYTFIVAPINAVGWGPWSLMTAWVLVT